MLPAFYTHTKKLHQNCSVFIPNSLYLSPRDNIALVAFKVRSSVFIFRRGKKRFLRHLIFISVQTCEEKNLNIAHPSKINLLLWSVSDLLSGARRLAPGEAPSVRVHPPSGGGGGRDFLIESGGGARADK
jgi:hypothetical protein